NLHHLVTYARHFLSPQEFEERLNRSRVEYYRYLAGSLLRGRDKSFWDYHKKTLKDAALGFSRTSLATAVLARIGSASLNLEQNIKRAQNSKALRNEAFYKE